MSLSELIKTVAYGDNEQEAARFVTSVTYGKNHREQLQAPSHAGVTCVTPITRKKTEVTVNDQAQNDDGDLRMSWLVLIDGKPARVAGTRKRSYIEVLRSVQARWPSYDIEVMK